MPDLTKLAADYTASTNASIAHLHTLATTLAEGIGELGEPQALHSAYTMAHALDRDRLEDLCAAALLVLAREKTGAQLRGRLRRKGKDTDA